MSTERNIRGELEYYLDYRPADDLVAEAEQWVQENPGVGLAEWVDAMIKIGAL